VKNEKLVLQHVGYARGLACQFWQHSPIPYQLDDYFGVAQLALVKAALQYDPEKGAFWPWARLRIWAALMDAVRAEGGRRLRPVFCELVDDLDGGPCYEIEDQVISKVTVAFAAGSLRSGSKVRSQVDMIAAGYDHQTIRAALGMNQNSYWVGYSYAIKRMREACL
jgi:hypothetical protein